MIVDDNIDEDQQSFVIVAEIGPDVPDGVSCFQITEGAARCHGRQGATEIRIIDNDRKFKTQSCEVHYQWAMVGDGARFSAHVSM